MAFLEWSLVYIEIEYLSGVVTVAGALLLAPNVQVRA